MRRWLAGLLLAIAVAAPAAAQSSAIQRELPPTIDAFDQVMRAWTERHRIYRATLAVSYQGRLILANGYGDARPDTPMHVGSISKSITAACIATLIQEGRLDWSSTLGETLADFFARNGKPRDRRVLDITVEQLLTHRAGFGVGATPDPWYQAYRNLLRYKRLAAITMEDVLEQGLYVPLGSAPGETYRYANLGYHALGLIVEARAGRPYGEYCVEKVFGRLGRTGSTLSPRWASVWAAGGWRIRAPDYLAFLKTLDAGNDTLFTPETKRWIAAAEGKWTSERHTRFYSLGLQVAEQNGALAFSHGGKLDLALSDTSEGALNSDFGAWMTRTEFGPAWFVAYQPWPGMAGILELRDELLRAGRGVHDWPDGDRFAEFGLR